MKQLFTFILLFTATILLAQEQWTTKAPMLTARHACAATVLNDTIYVIGGSDAVNLTAVVEAYDPISNTWSSKTSMSTARAELGVASVNGKIYAIGGYTGSATNIVEEYNPIANSWVTKSPMPTPRSLISIDVINNKIYVVGGWQGDLATLEIYDPLLDSWTTGAPVPVGRHTINSCAVLNDSLYFIGGKSNNNVTYHNNNDVYDPLSNTWSTKALLPIMAFAGAATELNSKIHYLGGTAQLPGAGGFDNHYQYNTATNSWTNKLNLTSKRSRHVAVTCLNKIYIIGGADEFGVISNLNEVYEVCAIDTGVVSTLNQGVITLASNQVGASYQWIDCNNGNSHINGATTQSYIVSQNGSYAVIVSNGNCVDTSACLVVNTVGINNEKGAAGFIVYPNPTTDFFIIKANGAFQNSKYEVSDQLGRIILNGNLISQQTEIKMNGLAKGVYTLELIGEKPQSLKLIKE